MSTVFGLTEEEVLRLQEEMEPTDAGTETETDETEKVANEEEGAGNTESQEAETKTEDDDKTEGELKLDVAKEEGDTEVSKLRTELRASNAALKKATDDYQKLHKVMLDKGIITEEEEAESKQKEEALQAAFDTRQAKLLEMVEIMELNPKYADVREVCSQSNLDSLVDAFAQHYVSVNGGKYEEVVAAIEADIWKQVNPYKEIYTLVKKYHPKYAENTNKEEGKEKSTTEKVPAKETPSAAKIGSGSGAGATGWTAARIDALDEDELHTVPQDVYEKYLQGQLQ